VMDQILVLNVRKVSICIKENAFQDGTFKHDVTKTCKPCVKIV
jgi:hypothetical protein